MSTDIEERLRAHFADRAARTDLPGPEADTAVRAARERKGDGDGGPTIVPLDGHRARRRRLDGRTWLAVAAAAALLAGIAGAVALTSGDGTSDVSTDTRPTPTTTEADPAPEPAPPTTAPAPPETTVPDTVAPPAGGPAGPIVSVHGVLGSWSGSQWTGWDGSEDPPLGDTYQRIVLDQPITSVVSEARRETCAIDGRTSPDVGLTASGSPVGVSGIAVAGVADPRPRPVEVLDPANPDYREAARAVVADMGVDDPDPTVGQVVRADVDGDGVAEVVVVAERLSDGGLPGEAGEYSVVFLRRVRGGAVQNVVLADSIAGTGPDQTQAVDAYRVGALADLNGDGRMEVVVHYRYYEGSGTTVFDLGDDGNVLPVLQTGCGA